MTTVSKTFAAVGDASDLLSLAPVPKGPTSATYALTGTFVGTLVLEVTPDNGVTWNTLATFTTTGSGTVIGLPPGLATLSYRFRCTAYTSGSPISTMATVDPILATWVNSAGTAILQLKESGVYILGQVPSLPGTASAATSQRNIDVASVAGAAALSFGSTLTSGLQFFEVEEVVALAAAGAKYVAMTCVIPAGAIILSAQMNLDTLVVAGGTSVKVGLGLHGGTCNTWGNTSALTKNSKANLLGTTVLAGATTPEVCACASTATGLGDTNFSAGNVRVRIVYIVPTNLPDA